MTDLLLQSIPLAVTASTPLLLLVIGELLVQRSGVINLGIEGTMLTAALAAVIGAKATGSLVIGFACGIGAALVVATIFILLTVFANADQIVTGTSINLLALGVTGLIYRQMEATARLVQGVPQTAPTQRHLLVALMWIVAPALAALFLWCTSTGLRLRACGEHPEAVAVTGASVRFHRGLAVAIEAILAGIAGSFLSLALSSGFAENMTAGRGFIALAIVIFGRWKVAGAIGGCALFGIVAAGQYALQTSNPQIPFHLLLATPYVITLLVLCGATGRVQAPQALGRRTL